MYLLFTTGIRGKTHIEIEMVTFLKKDEWPFVFFFTFKKVSRFSVKINTYYLQQPRNSNLYPTTQKFKSISQLLVLCFSDKTFKYIKISQKWILFLKHLWSCFNLNYHLDTHSIKSHWHYIHTTPIAVCLSDNRKFI